MAETHEPDTVRPLGLVSERSISIVEPDVESRSIERVRRTVGVTKEAARAISITAPVSYTHLTLPTILLV